MENGFGFIIDTNDYAGNFEREMTAFLTGVIGECEVGEDMISDKYPIPIELNFGGTVAQVRDDGGCYRPTECWMDPESGQNNSVIIYFHEKPNDEQISFMKERVKLFDEAHKTIGPMAKWNARNPEIEILGFRLVKFEKIKEIEITME